MRKLLLPIALALGAAIGFAVAQNTPIYNFPGTTTFVATIPSGSSVPMALWQIHNTQGSSPLGAQTTVAVSPTGSVAWLIAKGNITTLDVSFPNPAELGQQLYVVPASGAITTLRVSTATGTLPGSRNSTSVLGGTVTSLATGSPAGWIYNYSADTWFRVQ